MNILGLVMPPWAKYAAIAAAILAVFGYGYTKGAAHESTKHDKYVAAQAAELVRVGAARNTVTEKVVTKYITVTVPKTQIVREIIGREVIRYVDRKVDVCPVSVAGRVLHDAAAGNTVPDPAGSANDAPSGVTTAAVIQTCADNYSTYHQVADRMRSLQEWNKEQAKVK